MIRLNKAAFGLGNFNTMQGGDRGDYAVTLSDEDAYGSRSYAIGDNTHAGSAYSGGRGASDLGGINIPGGMLDMPNVSIEDALKMLAQVEGEKLSPQLKTSILKTLGGLAVGLVTKNFGPLVASTPKLATAISQALNKGQTVAQAMKSALSLDIASGAITEAQIDAAIGSDPAAKAVSEAKVEKRQGADPAEVFSGGNSFKAYSNTIDGGNGNGNGAGDTGGGTTNPTVPPPPVSTTQPISDQLNNMFVGENPQFSIPEMLEGRQRDIQNAYGDYATGIQGIRSDWDEFENQYSQMGASVMDRYENIGRQYNSAMSPLEGRIEGMADTYGRQMAPLEGRIEGMQDLYASQMAPLQGRQEGISDLLGQRTTDIGNRYNDVHSQYSQNMGSVPGLTMKLPAYMGGGSVPLAPGAWGNLYAQQAATQGNLLNQQSGAYNTGAVNQGNLLNNAANMYGQQAQTGANMMTAAGNLYTNRANALGSLTQGQANMIPDLAGITSTGISNRANTHQNQFANRMGMIDAQSMPLNIAIDQGSQQQQFANQMAINRDSRPDSPRWYESAIPALGYIAGNSGDDIIDAIGGLFS